MNVFTDIHHRDALDSLYRLFEGRLGMKLYVPGSMEYFKNGYLGLYERPIDEKILEGLCSHYKNPVKDENTILSKFGDYRYPIRHLPFSYFNDIKFDIFLPTLPPNILKFKKLSEINNPKAKLVFRAGNNWVARNRYFHPVNNLLLASIGTYIDGMTPLFRKIPYERKEELYGGYHWIENTPYGNFNVCYMHSEFNTSLFKPIYEFKNPNCMVSLMNCLDKFNAEYLIDICNKLKWELKLFGAANRDNIIEKIEDEALQLQRAGFFGHLKITDDGYGFNIHRAAYCGCQIITRTSYYKGRFSPDLYSSACLLFDKNTFIDVDLGNDYVISELKHRSENYKEYYEYAIKHSRKVIDFDEEEKKVRKFIENLI